MTAQIRPPEDTSLDGLTPEQSAEVVPSDSPADESPGDEALWQWWTERRPDLTVGGPTPHRLAAIRSAYHESLRPAPPNDLANITDPTKDSDFEPGELPADAIQPDWGEAAIPLALDDLAMTEPPTEAPEHLARQSLAAWYFAQMAGHLARYDHGRRSDGWMLWTGNSWMPDLKGVVDEMWRRVLAQRYKLALGVADDKVRMAAVAAVRDAGASDSAIRGGLEIASTMPPIATAADEWNRDPYLLGCENGVVDLRTGLIRDGQPEDLISRSTGVAYDPDATCPRFERFLLEVFASDRELIVWFAWLIGASLIGNALMELLVIHHGTGNNGKSVFMKALKRAVGAYGVSIGIETLVYERRRAGAATPDLMPLRGARVAFMAEPDQTDKLRGGTLKRLVSIEELTGRWLFGPQQSWSPTHTVHLSTNHLPSVDDAAEGTWRRLAAIPWTVHFRKPGEAGNDQPEDPGLLDVLYREAPGILAWAVRGAVAVMAGQSLWPFPSAVSMKTAAYRADQDQLAGFIAAKVVYEPGATVSLVALHKSYLAWCEAEEVPLGDQLRNRALGSAFDAHGRVQRTKDDHSRAIFRGARLRVDGDLWEADNVGEPPSSRVREEDGATSNARPRAEEFTTSGLISGTREPALSDEFLLTVRTSHRDDGES